MIDPTQLPILLKAIDFVFDEGRKILDERRERRKNSDSAANSENPEPAKETPPAEVQAAKETKQDLLASKIDDLLWKNHELEIQHLVSMLETHTKTDYRLKEQAAQWGSALVPPVIMLQIEDRENSIMEARKQLEDVLSKVYKKDITPNE